MTATCWLLLLFYVISHRVCHGHIHQGGSVEWCEYWTLLDQKELHPECALFVHTKDDILRKLGRHPDEFKTAATPPKCALESESFDCLECEPTCANPTPTCSRSDCARGCVCQTGLVRDSQNGDCIPASHCPVSNQDVILHIKKYMPVLLNDMWRVIFGTEKPPHPIDAPQLLSAIFADAFVSRKN